MAGMIASDMLPTLITAPYHLGHLDVGVGCGPEVLARWAVAGGQANSIDIRSVTPPGSTAHEVAGTFAVAAEIATTVRTVRESGRLPIVLAGNCMSCLGVLAGLAPPGVAVAWFDAHGDLNTAETTLTGFLDGMALSTAIGRCWHSLVKSIPGFVPVSEDNVLLIGGRSLDPGEAALIHEAQIAHVTEAQITEAGRTALEAPVEDVRSRTDRLYVHLDLDVLDPDEVPANQWRVAGGLCVTDLVEAIRVLASRFRIEAVTVASYDPSFDPHERARPALERLLGVLTPG